MPSSQKPSASSPSPMRKASSPPPTSTPPSSSSLPLPSSLHPYSNADIENKSQSRANPRFLCIFPGTFHILPHIQAAIKAQHSEVKAQAKAATSSPSPTPPFTDPSIIGRVGSIQSLDSRNPILTLDFPQGQVILKGTLVYPKEVRVMALQYQTRVGKKVKALQCRGTFDHFIVFSDWTWKGRGGEGEEGEEGGKEAIPHEVLTGPVGVNPTDEDLREASSEDNGLVQNLSEDEGEEEEVEEEREREDEGGEVEVEGGDDDVVVVSDDEEPRSLSGKARSGGNKVRRRRKTSDEEDSSDGGRDEAWGGREVDGGEANLAVQRPKRARGEVNYAVDVAGSDVDEEDVEEEDREKEEEEDGDDVIRRGSRGQSKVRAKETTVRRKGEKRRGRGGG